MGGGGGVEQGALCTRDCTSAGTSPKRSSLQGRRQKGGERRGKGEEIGERSKEKSFFPRLSSFLCMPRRLGYQRMCWGVELAE